MVKKKISLSDALFPKVRQRVLGLLYGQSDLDFHTNEIIRLTNSGSGAVQRELENLTATALIIVKQVGNQKRYQANKSALLFSELRNIVLKTFGLADILKEALKPITQQIYFGFIYGSIAKQQDTANSDIDLMLIGNNISYTDIFMLLEKVEKQLHRKINPTFYSISEWSRKCKESNNFIKKISDQPKIFLIGTENEFNKFGQSCENRSTKI